MRIICAPDSYKEAITAVEAAAAMARGVARMLPEAEVDPCPIADGGEGTVDAMLAAVGGRRMSTRVTGPLGQPVDAHWACLSEGVAVVELAAAAGLALVPAEQRDPERTTTFGVGQLLRVAVDHGCKRVIVGLGGSATNDAGCGLLQALGVRFLDARGEPITVPLTGGTLGQIASIDPDTIPRFAGRVQLTVACDVTNPLSGPDGAAAVFAPQKGADAEQVARLDGALRHVADRVATLLGDERSDRTPGAGAAGGAGAAMILLGATLQPGIDLVLDAVGFDARVRSCQLCLTGEGRLDAQSLRGKACLGVVRAAARYGVPTIALVGSAGPDAHLALEAGLHRYIVLAPDLPASESIRRTAELLEDTASRAARTLLR